MRVLAFDAGGDVGGAVVAEGKRCLSSRAFAAGRSAGPRLLPAIAQVLEEARLELRDVDALALVPGPGSFAGARIALATARGLDLALNADVGPGLEAPAVGVSASLPCVAAPAGWLLAQAAAQHYGPAATFALARISRRLLLCERFDFATSGRGPLKGAELLATPPEIMAWLARQLSERSMDDRPRLLGADAPVLYAELGHAGISCVELEPAAALVYLATHYVEVSQYVGISTVAAVEPLYARAAYVDDVRATSSGA